MKSITTRREIKPSKITGTVVKFDATRHRNRSTSFGAGLVAPTRWCGEYRAEPYTAEDSAFAAELFGDADRAAELDALEDAYNEMLDQLALEDAMLERYTRGHLAM
jgi:hypothetical protein